MKLKSFIILILWSSSAKKVLPIKISTINPCELNSIQSLYYLEADTSSNHIEPTEELKRTQRSFLKKFWKDIGLQDSFGDEGCVTCCNNNYNAAASDTYENQSTSSAIPFFQQLPPLYPLQPFDPLRIFQPFLRTIDFNTNGLNGAGYINNYDKGNTPKINGAENSYVINNNYEEGTSEGTECKNIEKYKAKENNDYSTDKFKKNGPIYTKKKEKIYKNSSVKNTYQNIDSAPMQETGLYTEDKSKTTQTKQTYPSLNGSSGSIVYQPIIYVSPQWLAAPPLHNSQQNPYQASEEPNLHYPKVKPHSYVYTSEKEELRSNLPSYDNFKAGPDTKVINSDQRLSFGIIPYSAILSNKIQPSVEYLNPYSHKNFVSEGAPPPSLLALLPSLSSGYGAESQCSGTEVTPSDIAIYTIVTQIPFSFAPSTQTHLFNANPYSYLNNIYDLYRYRSFTPPIILTEADQPYRSCPELFTDYLNQGNYKQNNAKGKTFVNAQLISC